MEDQISTHPHIETNFNTRPIFLDIYPTTQNNERYVEIYEKPDSKEENKYFT